MTDLKRMPLAYVAGPYRASSEWGVVSNIRRAEEVAIELWKRGFAVICPHKNTALFGGIGPDDIWLDGDLEMLRRCDLIVLAPGWERSSGALTERDMAETWGIPVVVWTGLDLDPAEFQIRGLDGGGD